MARITYSGLIESINGSIGGTTFQNNRYGFSVKRKPVPSKPNAPNQNLKKSAMTFVQKAWFDLTDGERSAWNTYAASFPRPTRLNPDAFLNGYNYFMAYHLIRKQFINSIELDPAASQTPLTFSPSVITVAGGVLTFDPNWAATTPTWLNLFYMSRVVTTTTQARENRLRYIDGEQVTAPTNKVVTSEYTTIFGDIPAIGDIVLVKQFVLRKFNGQIFESNIERITVT